MDITLKSWEPLPSSTRIALYGLSANPPSGLEGHQGIVRSLAQLNIFDEIWVLPVYQHIYTSKAKQLLPFEYRFDMCELTFSCESTNTTKVKILSLEKEVIEANPSMERVGTVDILEYILHFQPLVEITLVLGGDSLIDLLQKKWKQSERILQLCHIYSFTRIGWNILSISSEDLYVRYQNKLTITTNDKLGDISSTTLRTKKPWLLSQEEQALYNEQWIHPQVLQYIQQHQLYE